MEHIKTIIERVMEDIKERLKILNIGRNKCVINMGNSNRYRFRAWNNTNKKWYDEFLVIDCLGNIYRSDHGLYGIDEDIKIMLYTGLKDKNGKEIYEGDIIKWSNRLIEEVYFEPQEGWNAGTMCTIIGNIYENPELLGGIK